MLSEVRLIVGPREARLVLKKNDTDVVEDELWKFERRVTAQESQQLTRCVFDDAYQMIQHALYGDG